MEVVKKSKIEIEIGLDKDNFPAEINWSSTDAPAGLSCSKCEGDVAIVPR